MTLHSDIISSVQKSAAKRIIYLPHAVRQMSRPDRMIRVAEVRNVVERGGLVEDYPEDLRGHSCLILGYKPDDTPIHVEGRNDELLLLWREYGKGDCTLPC